MTEYVTVKKAAEILGVSDKRVYDLVKNERLECIKPNQLTVSVKSITEYIKSNRKAGRPRKNA